MSKSQKESAAFMATQRSLLDLIEEREMIQSFDIATAVRQTVSEAIRKCGLSRFEIASRMSENLGREITKAQLDSYSAESKDGHRFPLEWTPAFCWATRNYDLVMLVAGALRITVFNPDESEEALILKKEIELQRQMNELTNLKKLVEKRRRMK